MEIRKQAFCTLGGKKNSKTKLQRDFSGEIFLNLHSYFCPYLESPILIKLITKVSELSKFLMTCSNLPLRYVHDYTNQLSSATHSCLTLCNPMECSTLVFPVHHQFPELS